MRRFLSTSTTRRAMKIVPVPVREDNYAYLLIDEATKKAAVIDPYDVSKVSAAAEAHGVSLVSLITTHHHFDHSGGNSAFVEKYKGVPVYGGSDQVPALTELVKDKDEFTVGDNIHVKCLATPCHTQDSICYHVTDKSDKANPGGVFTGDTLFIGGCGRFFEGTPDEMNKALSYLGTLPDETVVFNGHEYTKGNVAFAQTIEPENGAIKKLSELAQKNAITTGLTTIGQEKQWNVFMRLNEETVKRATSASTESAVMEALRNGKNGFKG